MRNQVCAHTGKIIPRFLNILFADGNRHILVLYDRVRSRRFVEQHLIVLLAVLIQSVLRHRN